MALNAKPIRQDGYLRHNQGADLVAYCVDAAGAAEDWPSSPTLTVAGVDYAPSSVVADVASWALTAAQVETMLTGVMDGVAHSITLGSGDLKRDAITGVLKLRYEGQGRGSFTGTATVVVGPGSSDADIAAKISTPGTLVDDALKSTYAARSLRQYGKLGGRVDVGHLTGRTVAGGTVTTALTMGVQATIPLAELIDVTALAVVTNGLKIPADFPPVPVEIQYRATFTGGTAGKRIARLLVNGTEIDSASGYGVDISVVGRFNYRQLSPNDIITLGAWSDASGSSVSAARGGDVWLRVNRVTPRRVEPATLGWAWPNEVAGLEGKRGIYGMFMDRTSWADIAGGLNSVAYTTWVAANREKAADVAGPLTPYFMGGIVHNTELDALTAGTHDAEMATLGAALATTGPDTVYYRPFPEFNYTTVYSMTSAKFVAAWQRAIPLIRAAFAAAARPGQVLKIVWCFGGDGPDPQYFWPGTTHVDVVSVDTYLKKYNATATTANVTFQTVIDLCRACSYAAANGKPVAISEWANVAVGPAVNLWNGLGDWADGVDYIHDWIERAGILYAVYFNSTGGGVGQELADTPNSRARFIERFNLLTP